MWTTYPTWKINLIKLKVFTSLTIISFLITFAHATFAGEDSITPAPAGIGPQLTPYQLLEKSLTESLIVEKDQLAKFHTLLLNAREFDQLSRERLDAYEVQLTAHRNILLSNIKGYELQEAYNQYQIVLNKLNVLETEINQKNLTELENTILSTTHSLQAKETQREEIVQESTAFELRDKILNDLNALIKTVSAQLKTLNEIKEIYSDLLGKTAKLKGEYNTVNDQYNRKISEQEQQRLLKRQTIPISQLNFVQIRNEVNRLKEKAKQFLEKEIGLTDVKAYNLFLLTYTLLFITFEILLAFCQRFLSRERKILKESDHFWQYLTLLLIQRSLVLLGAILFILFFPIRSGYGFTPIFIFLKFIVDILILVLVVRWGLTFLKAFCSRSESPFFCFLNNSLTTLLYGFLVFGILFYLLEAGLCLDCILLVIIRLMFELAFLFWGISFWRRFKGYAEKFDLSEHPRFANLIRFLPPVGYLIIVTGLIFEILGYGAMAQFWYISLGKNAVVAFWFGVLYMALKEASPSDSPKAEADEEEPETDKETPPSLQIFVVRLSKAGLLFLFPLGILISWGARNAQLSAILNAFNYQMSLGAIQISLMDLAIAVFIVFLTHALLGVWKALLKEKILAKRDLEPGLKASVISITSYIGWLIGILLVFQVIGISMASLAVLFGAVGIGIGFGLQNIFNNFLSGIILLFERPIQVGDVIEMNGTWGTVAKINVRSTQVKTFDNADLIIPNADLISGQLTNWSFKDVKVRRTITVGVAYGSDVDLVMENLNKIASKHSRVYRRPAPQVLFSDFGDSALIFKLRIWAHIDHFLIVETDIRRSIDKEFKKLGITIPFPQRDIHVMNGYQGALPATE